MEVQFVVQGGEAPEGIKYVMKWPLPVPRVDDQIVFENDNLVEGAYFFVKEEPLWWPTRHKITLYLEGCGIRDHDEMPETDEEARAYIMRCFEGTDKALNGAKEG